MSTIDAALQIGGGAIDSPMGESPDSLTIMQVYRLRIPLFSFLLTALFTDIP